VIVLDGSEVEGAKANDHTDCPRVRNRRSRHGRRRRHRPQSHKLRNNDLNSGGSLVPGASSASCGEATLNPTP
jgi:hypothetical protein